MNGRKGLFSGVDIAGPDNTWIAWIEENSGSLQVSVEKNDRSIKQLADSLNGSQVVAIDAPLSYPLLEHYRESDEELKNMLGNEVSSIVMSPNSMMAVPLRGGFLQKELQKGDAIEVIEAHPRASAYLLGLNKKGLLDRYKKGKDPDPNLSKELTYQFIPKMEGMTGMSVSHSIEDIGNDGLDALICAFTAYFVEKSGSSGFSECLHSLGKESDSKEETIGEKLVPYYVLKDEAEWPVQ